MAWWRSKNKKAAGYSYLDSYVIVEGRLCFNGVTRLDGRVIGEVVSMGTLVVEAGAVIKGDVVVENLILSGTIIGDIQAFKHMQINSSAKVRGQISYGHLSIEGAILEGLSHKLRDDEITVIQQYCSSVLAEMESSAEKACFDTDAEIQELANRLPAKFTKVASALGRAEAERIEANTAVALVGAGTDSEVMDDLGIRVPLKSAKTAPNGKSGFRRLGTERGTNATVRADGGEKQADDSGGYGLVAEKNGSES